MTKPTIVTRAGKGVALTYAEQDANFTNLRDATLSVTDGTNSHAFNLNDTITFTAGSNITLAVNSTTGAITINSSSGSGSITAGHGTYIPMYSGSIGSTGTTLQESKIYTTSSGITWNDNSDFQITVNSSYAVKIIGGTGLATTTLTATDHHITPIVKTSLPTTGSLGDVYMIYTTGTSDARMVFWDNGNARWSFVNDNSDINVSVPTLTTGSYVNTNITVDSQGRISSVSNGPTASSSSTITATVTGSITLAASHFQPDTLNYIIDFDTMYTAYNGSIVTLDLRNIQTNYGVPYTFSFISKSTSNNTVYIQIQTVGDYGVTHTINPNLLLSFNSSSHQVRMTVLPPTIFGATVVPQRWFIENISGINAY